MKNRCHTKKGSIYAVLAILFAMLMLAGSVICIRFDRELSFQWLRLQFEDEGRLVGAASALLPAACAVVMIAVCAALCIGLKPRTLLIAASALVLFSLCRYAADLYTTLQIDQKDFYVISTEHIDLAFSLAVFVLTLLTVCNVFKHNAPLTLTAMILGLSSLVLTVLQTGSFYCDGVTDLSGMIAFLSGCMAIALCALTLEWDAETQSPKTIPVPATEPVAAPAEPTIDGLPAPAPGYVWELGATDPDGTKLYISRRVFHDIKTGIEVPGPYTETWYPHAPKREEQAAPQAEPQAPTEAKIQPSGQTLALLQQVEKLHESGILTDEEYREKCRLILEKV